MRRSFPKLRLFLTTYVWNATTFKALLFLSPAILTSIGSTAMSLSIDSKVAALTKDREAITENSGKLENFSRDFENYRLQRASNLIVLSGTAGEEKLKYMLDKLYRLNSQASMRRIVAITHPSDWQQRMADYEKITVTDYEDAPTVQKLQGMENEVSIEAARRLTAFQAANNKLSEEIERLANWKTLVTNIGNYLIYVLTALLFFLRTNS